MPPKTDDPAATLPPIVTLDNRPHAVYPMRGGGNIHVRVTTHLCRFWRERRGIGQATIDYELRDYDDTIAHFLAGAVSAMLASRTTLQGNATADEKVAAWQKIVDIENGRGK